MRRCCVGACAALDPARRVAVREEKEGEDGPREGDGVLRGRASAFGGPRREKDELRLGTGQEKMQKGCKKCDQGIGSTEK